MFRLLLIDDGNALLIIATKNLLKICSISKCYFVLCIYCIRPRDIYDSDYDTKAFYVFFSLCDQNVQYSCCFFNHKNSSFKYILPIYLNEIYIFYVVNWQYGEPVIMIFIVGFQGFQFNSMHPTCNKLYIAVNFNM